MTAALSRRNRKLFAERCRLVEEYAGRGLAWAPLERIADRFVAWVQIDRRDCMVLDQMNPYSFACMCIGSMEDREFLRHLPDQWVNPDEWRLSHV